MSGFVECFQFFYRFSSWLVIHEHKMRNYILALNILMLNTFKSNDMTATSLRQSRGDYCWYYILK